MHIKLKMVLVVLAIPFLQFSLYSMQVNYGYMASCDCTISTYKYINNGTVQGSNSVKIDVSSLTGSGTVSSSNHVSIKSDYFGYTGTISASQRCSITSKIFEENATITAPNITIACDEFKFSGTISCEKECTIYAKKEFDTNAFKKAGNGNFKVVISPYDIEYFSREDLVSKSCNDLCCSCLNLTEDTIDKMIERIRTYAVLNFIDEKTILESIREKIGVTANFHKDRLGKQQDMDSLYSGLTKCGVSVIGLGISYAIFKNEQILSQKFNTSAKLVAAISGTLSTLPAIFSLYDFYSWRNPRHKEKYKGFSLIINRIDQALKTPRVPEEQIITLI